MDSYVNLRHLEWLIGEPVPDWESVSDREPVLYEVLPYTPAQAERIIGHLCGLAALDVARADEDPASAERVRRAFAFILDGARALQALLDLHAIEREIGRSPWRDLLKDLQPERSPRRGH